MTIELDKLSDHQQYRAAATALLEAIGVEANYAGIQEVIAKLKHMADGVCAPYELRFGSRDKEPDIVIWPVDRVGAMAVKAQELAAGSWAETLLEVDPENRRVRTEVLKPRSG